MVPNPRRQRENKTPDVCVRARFASRKMLSRTSSPPHCSREVFFICREQTRGKLAVFYGNRTYVFGTISIRKSPDGYIY